MSAGLISLKASLLDLQTASFFLCHHKAFSLCIYPWFLFIFLQDSSSSVMSDFFVTLWTVPATILCPWNFPGKEYWSGLPFPTPGDLPDPGIKPASLASLALAGRFFTMRHLGSPHLLIRTPVILDQGSTLLTSFNFHYLLKVPKSPNVVILRVRVSTCIFEGCAIRPHY